VLRQYAVSRRALQRLRHRSGLPDADGSLLRGHLYQCHLRFGRQAWLHQLYQSGGLPNAEPLLRGYLHQWHLQLRHRR
jgi:hypothetical protein